VVVGAVVGAFVLNVVLALGVGYGLATHTRVDALAPADAVVVLAGAHDGREVYGIELARQVGAHTVLLSNSYPPDDEVMRRICRATSAEIEIVCRTPEPSTTRGEAIMARELADARGWQRIVVLTWRHHLPRARIIFGQCYSDDTDAIIVRHMPGKPDLRLHSLLYFYVYQYMATGKTLLLGDCDAGKG